MRLEGPLMSEMQGSVENNSLLVRQDEMPACVCTVYVQRYVVYVCVSKTKGKKEGNLCSSVTERV